MNAHKKRESDRETEEREKGKRKSSPPAVAPSCHSDVPFSAAMIRLHRNTSPSLIYTHTHTILPF